MKIMTATESVKENYETLESSLREFKEVLKADVLQSGKMADKQAKDITQLLAPRIDQLINTIEITNSSNRGIIRSIDVSQYSLSAREQDVVALLEKYGENASVHLIAKKLNLSTNTVVGYITLLMQKGVVEGISKGP